MIRSKRIAAIIMIVLLIAMTFQMQVFAGKPVKVLKLSAPTGLAASNITTGSIDLNWGAVTNALGYKVFVATPNDSGYTQLASVTQTSYKAATLNSGTSYWFYVQAYNGTVVSAGSTHINAVTLQPAPPPPPPTSSKEILGFATYYYSGDKTSYNSMVANTASIDQIATLTYNTDASGNLTGMIPTEQLTYANNNGISSLAMITNNFDGSIAKAILESSTNRQNLINNILNQIKTNGYSGVNVDLENVPAADRDYYTTFMSELYGTLKPLGYQVTMDVPAKTNDSSANTWNYAYNYAALASYTDKIVIMAYDEHYPGGTPGAIASINWVNNVVNYALTVIPKEKLSLGVAAYGYDWSSNGTKAYSINGITNLAAANNAQILWDDISKSPYFKYTDTAGVAHSVWFENAQSVAYKLDIVNNSNLCGIAIWRLGLENTDYWTTVNSKLGR